MAGDAFLIRDGPVSVPLAYQVPQSGEMLPLSVRATLNGASSGQAFYAVVQLVAPSGRVLGNYITQPIAAGASADVTWFPGAELEDDTAQTGGGGGIDTLTSSAATIAVSSPTGPTTNVDLPASGVAAGTYGDGAHVAQVVVNAEGVVTNASSIAISGTVGGFTKLFDQTLGADTATIDTGVNGVASGYAGLLIYVRGRRNDAIFSGGFGLQFNGDTAANYDYLWTDNSSGTVTGIVSNSQSNTKVMEGPGASVRANTFGLAQCWILGYTDTSGFKSVTSHGGFSDGSTHGELVNAISSWNSTAAINQITLTVGAGVKLVTGSRLTIWGLL